MIVVVVLTIGDFCAIVAIIVVANYKDGTIEDTHRGWKYLG
jgi:hypothetical protein